MHKLLKIGLLSLFEILSVQYCFAQNLVTNWSFEQYDTCPTNQWQVKYATGWDSYGDTPDYFNSCSPIFTEFSVPNNWGGYQQAATGNAYCAFGSYAPIIPNIREVIGSQLISPLNIGMKYYVGFKVSLSISGYILSFIATDKLGALFTTTAITWPPALLNNFAHSIYRLNCSGFSELDYN